jgi:hypothetical protein
MQPDLEQASAPTLFELTDGVLSDDGTYDAELHEQQKALRAAEEADAAAETANMPAPPMAPPDLNGNAPDLDPLPAEFLPPESITAYVFPPSDLGDFNREEEFAVIEAGKEARTWMQQAGMPAEFGTALARQAAQIGDITGGSDDAAYEVGVRKVQQGFQQAWGQEAYAARAEALSQMIDHLDRKFDGRVSQFLDANPGLLLSPVFYGQLLAHAERVKGRLR